jgi:hypothetical protein
MSDDGTGKKWQLIKFGTRDWIYAGVLIIGFALIASGLNGVFSWGLTDTVTGGIGGILGFAAAYWIAWLKRR